MQGFFFFQAANTLGAIEGFFLNLISAVHRSKASCMRSQPSGVPPTALEMRMAISAVTAFFSCSKSDRLSTDHETRSKLSLCPCQFWQHIFT